MLIWLMDSGSKRPDLREAQNHEKRWKVLFYLLIWLKQVASDAEDDRHLAIASDVFTSEMNTQKAANRQTIATSALAASVVLSMGHILE